MKAIVKDGARPPRVWDIEGTPENISSYVGAFPEQHNFAVDAAVVFDSEWRDWDLEPHSVIGGKELGGMVLIVGITADGRYTDVPQPEVTMELLWPTAEHKKRPTPARAGR